MIDPENDLGSKHPQRCPINHSSALRFELEFTAINIERFSDEANREQFK